MFSANLLFFFIWHDKQAKRNPKACPAYIMDSKAHLSVLSSSPASNLQGPSTTIRKTVIKKKKRLIYTYPLQFGVQS